VIFRRDMGWPLHSVNEPQQSDDMARARLFNGGVKAREGADMDHDGPR